MPFINISFSLVLISILTHAFSVHFILSTELNYLIYSSFIRLLTSCCRHTFTVNGVSPNLKNSYHTPHFRSCNISFVSYFITISIDIFIQFILFPYLFISIYTTIYHMFCVSDAHRVLSSLRTSNNVVL